MVIGAAVKRSGVICGAECKAMLCDVVKCYVAKCRVCRVVLCVVVTPSNRYCSTFRHIL